MRNIVVVPYDDGWPCAFQREAALLSGAFGDELIAIHHIGSTSVPGLSAKPVIDIMPVVRDVERVDTLTPALERLGYQPWGENGIPGRRYFTKGGDLHRTHNMHVYELSNPEVERHLAFRDYLRSNPAEAERYAELKRAVAAQFPNDIYGYMAGKDAYIKTVLQRALEWRAVSVAPPPRTPGASAARSSRSPRTPRPAGWSGRCAG